MMSKAKPITPYKHGHLVRSGMVDRPKRVSGGVKVRFGFGSQAVQYAVPQHERLDYRHAPGKQAHYLEEPFEELSVGHFNRMLRRVMRAQERRVKVTGGS